MTEDSAPERLAATVRAFLEQVAATAERRRNPLQERLRSHLGTDPLMLPVVAEEFDSYEQPNVQVALDAMLSKPDRQAERVGITAPGKRYMDFSLSDLLAPGSHPAGQAVSEGPLDYVNFHLPDRTLPCVQYGLIFLTTERGPAVLYISGPSQRAGPLVRMRVEAIAPDQQHALLLLEELQADMRRLNVYRGHVISLSPKGLGMGAQTLVEFHRLPPVERDGVVLPEGTLERIERHTIGFSRYARELQAGARSLKRGLLLYGPPGTGKTLTIMYLARSMPERTVILTTGRGMGLVESVARMARTLVPSMVVLEDVDLIAEQRGQPFMPTGPLLFELLNEMDGLGDDADVIFALTTNRPDILEPALAARPGRIDLAVELPLPDAPGRRRLFELYARGLTLEDVDLDQYVEHTAGVSPAYIKELLRKAALLAAEQRTPSHVQGRHLDAAMDELNQGGELAQRILGFRPDPDGGRRVRPMPPTGFPLPGSR